MLNINDMFIYIDNVNEDVYIMMKPNDELLK